MQAIAPNLTVLVGELVGARLIAHAGTLINLAKAPASTVQILGAEKALFRALKTKHATPKYGLIFHASLIGQASPKNKGKVARVLAAKCSLAVRVDALGDGGEGAQVGVDARAKVRAHPLCCVSLDATSFTLLLCLCSGSSRAFQPAVALWQAPGPMTTTHFHSF
jgi:nucleolar protein 58